MARRGKTVMENIPGVDLNKYTMVLIAKRK
jgi:hypothetical protein